MQQLDARKIEREAAHLLPEILEGLLDESGQEPRLEAGVFDRGIDFTAETGGQRWLFEVKASSSPGLVAAAAKQLDAFDAEGLRVLVVPFMSPAGEKAAASFGLNWIDLSGNAHVRADHLYIWVRGKPNRFVSRGRPSSPFAPKSARVTRKLLLDPGRWWRQRDLATVTGLNNGQVSRVVRRLREEGLVDTEGPDLRPRDPGALLDAWSDEYRFDRHEVVRGHVSGAGVELTRDLGERLTETDFRFAFTGLPAAWLLDPFARFRLSSVYVDGDPNDVAEELGMRLNERGANVQLIAPDDDGVFAGEKVIEGLPCVSPVQVYLDLLHLPERAGEAAENLRERGLWNAARP